ncbi:MAG: hypothetical protein ACPG19_14160 [Saprospiraceae bacterium]
MNNQILDEEELQLPRALETPIESTQKRQMEYRTGAMLLEGVPMFLLILCLLIGNKRLLSFAGFLLSFTYLFGGWYIFKGDKYRAKDIILVTVSIFFTLFQIPLIFLFKIMHWPGAMEMWNNLPLTVTIFLSIWTTWYLYYRYRRPLERRLSAKIVSRIAILGLLLLGFMKLYF